MKEIDIQFRPPPKTYFWWDLSDKTRKWMIEITLRVYTNFKILTLPIASSPLSKNNSIPRNKKAIPNPASPTPISEGTNHTKYDKYVPIINGNWSPLRFLFSKSAPAPPTLKRMTNNKIKFPSWF